MIPMRRTLLVSFLSLSLFGGSALAEGYHFTDADRIPWASSSIERLYQEGLIKGVSENRFEPHRPISRAEFAALMAKQVNQEYSSKPMEFQDVSSSDWFYEPVHKLYSMGMIKGANPTEFMPHKEITREEAAVILARTFDYSHKGDALSYKDQEQISPWAKTSVMALSERGMFSGFGDQFKPKQPITRAEVAVVLHRILFGEPAPYKEPTVKKPSRSTDQLQKRLQNIAVSLVGTPYVWGGETTKGFDCSGFTKYVYSQLGVELPRVSKDQFQVGQAVEKSEMQVGDLIFFDTGQGYINHVGIYMGNNKMAHAASGQKQVKVQDLDWYYNNYKVVGIKRVL